MTTKTPDQTLTSKQFTELLASKGTNNYQNEPRALSSGIRVRKGTGGASDVITLYGGDPESSLSPSPNRQTPRGGTMSTVIEWQPYVTINHGLGEIIQHESLWLDTQGYSQVILDIRALQVSAVDLIIETSESLDNNAWHEVTNLSTGASQVQVAISRNLPRSDSSRLRRYLRWRSDSASKEFCFRILAQLKR